MSLACIGPLSHNCRHQPKSWASPMHFQFVMSLAFAFPICITNWKCIGEAQDFGTLSYFAFLLPYHTLSTNHCYTYGWGLVTLMLSYIHVHCVYSSLDCPLVHVSTIRILAKFKCTTLRRLCVMQQCISMHQYYGYLVSPHDFGTMHAAYGDLWVP